MVMEMATADNFGQQLVNLGLITDRQLQSVWSEMTSHDVDLDVFIQSLIRKELLTNFQVERVKNGKTKGYFHGDYKLLYNIGEGTYARVFRAVNVVTGEICALKVLRNRYSNAPDDFIKEGRIGKLLQHQNIVQIYDVASEKGYHYMVMEFVEGQTLRDFLKIRGKLTAKEALPIIGQVAAGLQYAFEQNLCHRDMKLTNVLLTPKGEVKIADFGLAGQGRDNELEDDSGIARTCDYAGLERASGVKKGDPRSDIFFLGCMFYELLTGTAPIEPTKDKVYRASSARFMNIKPITEVLPTIPLIVAAVVKKAMEVDAGRRYQTPGAMLMDIKKILIRLREDPTGKLLDDMKLEETQLSIGNHSVMLVERDNRVQDKLRDLLKKANWKVLITIDPRRAVDRMVQNREIAECLLILSRSLEYDEEEVIKLFNELPTYDSPFSRMRAVLVLETTHSHWREQLNTDPWRAILDMPITARSLVDTMKELIEKPIKLEDLNQDSSPEE